MKTSLYASSGCNWKDSFAGEEFNVIQTSKFHFRKFGLDLPITLPPNALCFSTLDAVGSHLHVADRSICNQDQNVLLHQIIKQCGYHFMIGSTFYISKQELQIKHNFCSSTVLILVTNASTSVRSDSPQIM